MKKMFIALLLVPMVNAEELIDIKFNMSCKVTGQVLIKTVDGIATKYSGFTDDLKDGDVFDIVFALAEAYDGYYYLNLKNTNLEILGYATKDDAEMSSKDAIHFDRNGNQLWINDNRITYRGIFANASMNRYYKNDWQIMVTNKANVGETHRTLTANCLNMPSGFDDMIEAFKKLDGEKWKGDAYAGAEKVTD